MRHLAIVYIAMRAVVFSLMAKTQFDERRYIMPQLRRYDLLTMEFIDREQQVHENIEKLINALPRFTDKIMQGR